jgi:hypothetical protein
LRGAVITSRLFTNRRGDPENIELDGHVANAPRHDGGADGHADLSDPLAVTFNE